MSSDFVRTVHIASLLVSSTIILYISRFVYLHLLRPSWFLRHIPGPSRESLLFGHMRSVSRAPPGDMHEKWHNKYGSVVTYDGFLKIPRISISDKRALSHILVSEPFKFPKPSFLRRALGQVLGEGVLFAEGATHTRQRKIMNPSFGPAYMKSIYTIFTDKADHLRDVMLQKMADDLSRPSRIDFYEFSSRATLDVIAAAGFGYEVNAIEMGRKNEMAEAFWTLFDAVQDISFWYLLTNFFPILRQIPDISKRGKAIRNAVSIMRRLGTELVAEKKNFALQLTKVGITKDSQHGETNGRDLLSVLVKANMATDLKPSQKLTDDEVMAQITTFLLAGNDTTANAMCWALYALCRDQNVQSTLRKEIEGVFTEHPSFDELNGLPFLDAVVRETLRLYSPVSGTIRVATEDSIIPLSEPIIDARGQPRHEIHVAKGTGLFVPIVAMNRSEAVWGPDAKDFKPERWLSGGLPDGALEMPSIAFPTFLAGPRACIGFRFSIIEMKTMLFSLLRAIQFNLADPASDIEGQATVVTRPRVRSRPEEGYQLPLLLHPVTS